MGNVSVNTTGKSNIVASAHTLWEIWYLNKHISDQLDDNTGFVLIAVMMFDCQLIVFGKFS